jgi:hypothetical protein
MNSNDRCVNDLANKLSKKLPTYEVILAVIAIVGLALKIAHFSFGEQLLIIALLSLSMLNMIMAHTTPKEDTLPFDAFNKKAQSMGISVTMVGLLFLLLNWKGSLNMLMVGTITLVVTISYHLLKKHPIEVVLKPIIILAIALILFFTPKEALQNLHIVSNNVISK